MKAEYQLQIDAIKGKRIFYEEYGELILVTDGRIGVYLKDKELKIDKSKMIKFKRDKGSISLHPEELLKERTAAIQTNFAIKIPYRGYAIKIKAKESGEHCFVNEKYLKMFNGFNNLFIKSKKDPVLVYRFGVPYGIILPMHIAIAEEEA